MIIETITQINEEILEVVERLIPQLKPACIPPGRKELEEIITSGSSTLLAARIQPEGPIVGILTLVMYRIPTGVHAWIEDVVVDEAVRGKGVGAELTNTAVRMADEQGASAVYLTSNPAREAANHLYQKLGFIQRHTNLYYYPFADR